VDEPATVRAAAGHMHLLGSAIRIELNPGRPGARTLLDVKQWDFDNQGSIPVAATRLRVGDQVKVTCTHDQSWRDKLAELRTIPERYVVWGEGTTDEMCLGILSVTRP
jgi:protein involved in polysaccharide export with SLBB domain